MLLMLDGMLLLLVKSNVVCNCEFWLKAGSGELTLRLLLRCYLVSPRAHGTVCISNANAD